MKIKCCRCGAPIEQSVNKRRKYCADCAYKMRHVQRAAWTRTHVAEKSLNERTSLARKHAHRAMRRLHEAAAAARAAAGVTVTGDVPVAVIRDAASGTSVQWRGQMCGGGSSATWRHDY